MPGLKRSPGLADIDAQDGVHQTAHTARDSASRTKQRVSLEGITNYRISTVDPTAYPYFPPALSGSWPESPSDDDSSSDVLVHEGYENLIVAPPQRRARVMSFEENGMPPTPPTMNNSDAADTNEEQRPSPAPVFADDIRSALETKASGLSGTPVNAVSPPTPDPSPPIPSEDVPVLEQQEKSHFLHPMVAQSRSLRTLRDNASSRAESFRTAREDQPVDERRNTSEVQLPEDDTLPEHWLDTTREFETADRGLGDVAVKETPKEDDATPKLSTQTRRRRRTSKHESPPQTRDGPDTDWEKHISYVSGPDDIDGLAAPIDDVKKSSTQPLANGLGLSGPGMQHENGHSVEDVNNMVYKRIQEENVKRHSSVSSRSGAIPVGIVVPPSDSTPRTLKRQTKCSSLRGDDEIESRRSSVNMEARMLTHKKIRVPERQKKLDDSPVFESSIRQVSSPARLGPDATNMTALTYASLQESPSARQAAKFLPRRNHTLRHTSHGDRLSNNMSVRRTSIHGSPGSPNRWLEDVKDAEPPVHSPPITPPRRLLPSDRIVHNIGVKRNSADGARPSRVLERPSNPVRGVIPSVTTEPEEASPTSGRLRRFSRDERLENNDHVRRTSIGSSRGVSRDYDPPPRLPSPERPLFPDHSTLPSSPRRSLDVRHLQPTTTPMSISQFSDRDDVEVLEASGVRIYPHNNESLLLVQHGSRPQSKDDETLESEVLDERSRGLGPPIFAAQVDPPTPPIGMSRANVDSPLKNPRMAPEPPVIQFIPPTPNEELERELGVQQAAALRAEHNLPQRRLSLLQKARRYSDSLFVRAGSLRRPRRYSLEPDAPRANHLSPLWRPQGFWDEFDSDEEYLDDFEAAGTLPKGGDTSDIVDSVEARKTGGFPRLMSKRLPGFRGQGGFLVGNSLGIDRHGTNTRRHYVSTTSRTLSPKESAEVLNRLAANNTSQGSLTRVSRDGRTFIVPFSGGRRAQWVGTKRLRARMQRSKSERDEREREKRRESLRGKIGMRVYHDTAGR